MYPRQYTHLLRYVSRYILYLDNPSDALWLVFPVGGCVQSCVLVLLSSVAKLRATLASYTLTPLTHVMIVLPWGYTFLLLPLASIATTNTRHITLSIFSDRLHFNTRICAQVFKGQAGLSSANALLTLEKTAPNNRWRAIRLSVSDWKGSSRDWIASTP